MPIEKCPRGKLLFNVLPFLMLYNSSFVATFFFIYRKPAGLNAGRKLKTHRRNERWSSKKYNKSHSVAHMKANPLGGSCMSKGIVVEKM